MAFTARPLIGLSGSDGAFCDWSVRFVTLDLISYGAVSHFSTSVANHSIDHVPRDCDWFSSWAAQSTCA